MVDVSPRVDQPKNGIYGLLVSTASDSTLEISAGRCKDSSNKIDIGVGSDYAEWTGGSVSAPLTIDVSVVGANGIDAGSIGASKVYAVYVIADSSGANSVAGLCSLASNSTPTMPFGYDAYRLVGYAVSDSSSDFLPMDQTGHEAQRRLLFDAPQSLVSGDSNTSYADKDASALIAPQDNALAWLRVIQKGNAAGDTLNIRKNGNTGDFYEQEAQVATGSADLYAVAQVPVDSNAVLEAKVSAGSYDLLVLGFEYHV